MNSGSLPPGRTSRPPLQPQWQRQIETWRDLIAQCALKPTRKRVHTLRSLTLRLRVVLSYVIQKGAENPDATASFSRWSKEAKRLRRGLGLVRDADVYLARLNSLCAPGRIAATGRTQLTPRCLREARKLSARLKQRRQAKIDKLSTYLDSHGKRLIRLAKEVELDLAPRMQSTFASAAPAALRIFSELAGQLPHLDVANLHEYRKRLKEALYLAESSAPVDPTAKRLAVAFRKIHSSAGAWHDWHSLATQVTRLFPRNDPQTGLVPVLDSLAAAALDQAVGLCQQSAVRLLHRSDETRPASKRKPVAPSSVEVLTLMLLG